MKEVMEVYHERKVSSANTYFLNMTIRTLGIFGGYKYGIPV